MTAEKEKIIVTGVNGFVGEHLARHLRESDFYVHGIGREETPNKNVAPYLDSYEAGDLLIKERVAKLSLKKARAIIHLAGLASVADSFNQPELYKTGNAEMTDNLLTEASSQGFEGRFVAVSSGALYDGSDDMPLTELSRVAESSPYATGKLRAEAIVKRHRMNGLDAVIARPFNHIGPGQDKGFLVSDLYDQLIKAYEDGSKQISVGNLSTRRDYTDVRDIVAAYAKLASAPRLIYDTYNVASRKSYSGFEILDYLKNAMSLKEIEPIVDQARVRPTDAMDIIGDSSRLKNELNWETLSSPETAINDFVARRQAEANESSETLVA